MHSCSLNCHLSPDSGTYTSGSNLQYGFRPVCPSVSWTPPHRHPKCSSCPLRPELRSTGPIFSVCLITQSCSTLCNPMYCSLPGCSVHGILQARMLEWVAMPSCRASSQPRDRTQLSRIAGRFFYHLCHQGSPHSHVSVFQNSISTYPVA